MAQLTRLWHIYLPVILFLILLPFLDNDTIFYTTRYILIAILVVITLYLAVARTHGIPFKAPRRIFIFATVFSGMFFIYWQQVDIDFSKIFHDELAHYFISRDLSLDRGGVVLAINEWGRPGNILAYTLPSQWDLERAIAARRLLAVIFTALSAVLVYRIGEQLGVQLPELIPLFFLAQPWVYSYGFQSLTPIPLTFALALAVYLWLRGKYFWGSVVFGTLPLIRHESILILVWWILFLSRYGFSQLNRQLPVNDVFLATVTGFWPKISLIGLWPLGITRETIQSVQQNRIPGRESRMAAWGLVLWSLFPYATWNLFSWMLLNEAPAFSLFNFSPDAEFPPQGAFYFVPAIIWGVSWIILVATLLGVALTLLRRPINIAERQQNADQDQGKSERHTSPSFETIVLHQQRWWIPFAIYLVTHVLISYAGRFSSGGYDIFLMPTATLFAVFAALVFRFPRRSDRFELWPAWFREPILERICLLFEKLFLPYAIRSYGDRCHIRNPNIPRVILFCWNLLLIFAVLPTVILNTYRPFDIVFPSSQPVSWCATTSEADDSDQAFEYLQDARQYLDDNPSTNVLTNNMLLRYKIELDTGAASSNLCPAAIYEVEPGFMLNRHSLQTGTVVVYDTEAYSGHDGLSYYTLLADEDWERIELLPDANNPWNDPEFEAVGRGIVGLEQFIEGETFNNSSWNNAEDHLRAVEGMYSVLLDDEANTSTNLLTMYVGITLWRQWVHSQVDSEADDRDRFAATRSEGHMSLAPTMRAATQDLQRQYENIPTSLLASGDQNRATDALVMLANFEFQISIGEPPTEKIEEIAGAVAVLEETFLNIRIPNNGSENPDYAYENPFPMVICPTDRGWGTSTREADFLYELDFSELSQAILIWSDFVSDKEAPTDRERIELRAALITIEEQLGRIRIHPTRDNGYIAIFKKQTDPITDPNMVTVSTQTPAQREAPPRSRDRYMQRICEFDAEPIRLIAIRDGIPVYNNPDANQVPFAILEGGTHLMALSKSAQLSWYEVALPDGRLGWVPRNDQNLVVESLPDDLDIPIQDLLEETSR